MLGYMLSTNIKPTPCSFSRLSRWYVPEIKKSQRMWNQRTKCKVEKYIKIVICVLLFFSFTLLYSVKHQIWSLTLKHQHNQKTFQKLKETKVPFFYLSNFSLFWMQSDSGLDYSRTNNNLEPFSCLLCFCCSCMSKLFEFDYRLVIWLAWS